MIVILPATPPPPSRSLLEIQAPATSEHRSVPAPGGAGSATPVPCIRKLPLTVIAMLPPLPPPVVFSAVISLPASISMFPPGTLIVMFWPLAARGPSHLMLPVLVSSRFSPAGSASTYGHGAVTAAEIVQSPGLCTPPPVVHATDANASPPNPPMTPATASTATTSALCRFITFLTLSMWHCLLSMWCLVRDAASIPDSGCLTSSPLLENSESFAP